MGSVATPWSKWLTVKVQGRPAGGTGAFVDVDCDLVQARITGGRASWDAEYDPGTCSITLQNPDGKHTPEVPGVSHILDVGASLQVLVGGVLMFGGDVSGLTERLAPDGSSTITVTALGGAAGVDASVDSTHNTGQGDSFPDRMNRISDLAGIRTGQARDFTTNSPAPADARHLEGNAFHLLRKTARDWGGVFYISRAGRLTTRIVDPNDPIRWKLRAGPSVAAGGMCVSSFAVERTASYIVNHVALQAHTSDQFYSWDDTASQDKYGVRSYIETDMVVPALISGTVVPDAEKLGRLLLDVGKHPSPRLRSVTIPIVDAQTASFVKDFRILDKVELDFEHPYNGWGYTTSELGRVSGFTFDADRRQARVTLRTGHPLEVVPTSSTASGSSGGTGGGVGPAGPRGPAGPKGDQGIQGIQGPKGDRGTMWFMGTDPVGQLPPPTGGFVIGDAYLHTGDAELWVYTAAGWHDRGVSLRGPQGPAGIQGVIGPAGHRGSWWAHGTGHPGTGQAPAGGWLEGDQWLDQNTGELYLYTRGAWADEGFSILGPQGPAGPAGHVGPAGPAGHKGDPGHAGAQGPRGQGLEFLTAVATVADLPAIGHAGGHVGDVHLVVADGRLYTPHNGAWVDVGHVQGPAGPRGPAGHVGPAGPAGHKGDPGHAGADGKTGPRGAHGSPGATGPAGHVGAQGPRGLQGPTGQISDAHGDNRYLRLDASNDPLTGALEIHNGVGEGGPAAMLHLSDTRKHPQSGGALTFGAFGGSVSSAFAGLKAHIEDAAHHGRGWLGIYMRKASTDSGMKLAHRIQSDGLQLPQNGIRIDHYSTAPASGSDKYGIQTRNIVMSDQAPHAQHGIQDGDCWIRYSWT